MADALDSAPVPSSYRGWPGFTLLNPFARVDVVPALGGRIMQYSLGDHPFLWVNPALAGRMPPPAGVGPAGSWLNYGGEKLWPAPQGWDSPEQWPGPPDAVLDGRAHAVSVAGSALHITSERDARSGIQFLRTLSLDPCSTCLRVDVTLRNVDSQPRRWGIWEHAQLEGGLAGGQPNLKLKSYCPLSPRSHFAAGYNVTFGAPGNPAWQADRANGLFTAAYGYTVGKAVVDSPAGWVATVDGARGVALVQRFVYQPEQDYPDGATVEFWHSGRGSFRAWGKENVMPDDPALNPCVVEPELVSPFFALEPGAFATWRYELCAAAVGADAPVVDCTAAAAVVQPLRAVRSGAKARISGRWGVFAPGQARGAWIGLDGRRIHDFDVAALSPLSAASVEAAVDCPPEAVGVVLELADSRGGKIGELGRSWLAGE